MCFSEGFVQCYGVLIGHEGAYSNHAADRGGETYKGISRVAHPSWPGWILVDECKNQEDFAQCLAVNEILEYAVKKFYHEEYWSVFSADELPVSVGYELFDIGVNMGVSKATELLQSALNAFNKQEDYWPDLNVDGAFGPKTLGTAKAMCALSSRDGEGVLVKALNCLQGARYIDIAYRNETQEVFMWGWFNRV